ncbi:MAG: Hint domain-containing protein [Pseudomonadota bacterium]
MQRTTRLAPASAAFEAPFMALARGTLLATPQGPTAIEDIVPGMDVTTLDGTARPVLWKGATSLLPGTGSQSEEARQLIRIPAGAMGILRPSHDLLLGFGARIVQRGRMVRATQLVDGEAALAVRPQSPVECFHIALPEHGAVRANGLDVETCHPGPAARHFARSDMRQLFLSLFPHVEDFADFGPLRFPRAVEDGDLAPGT